MYIKRNLERKFLKLNHFFKVMLVTGARQVGKTTMLKHLAEGTNRTYVSMDDLLARDLATRDPSLFFQRDKPPILIDEIQKSPALLTEIKRICDETEEGLFWLTGSQQFQMMTRVQETLAGRIGILHLYGLSQQEKRGISFTEETDFSWIRSFHVGRRLGHSPSGRFFSTSGGGMPGVQGVDEETRQAYYSSYVETYLFRDGGGGRGDGLFQVRTFPAGLCGTCVGTGELLYAGAGGRHFHPDGEELAALAVRSGCALPVAAFL